MYRGLRDEDGRRRSVDDGVEPSPSVKLFCVLGLVVGFGHAFVFASILSSDPHAWLVAFTTIGTCLGCVVYGLWTLQHWAWEVGMLWFAVAGALAWATFEAGTAIVTFTLLVALKHLRSSFE